TVLRGDRLRADRLRPREEAGAEGARRLAASREAGVLAQEGLEHAVEDLPLLARDDVQLGRRLLVYAEQVGGEELEAAGGEPLESAGTPPHGCDVRLERPELTREPADVGVGERLFTRLLGARGEEVPAPTDLDLRPRVDSSDARRPVRKGHPEGRREPVRKRALF